MTTNDEIEIEKLLDRHGRYYSRMTMSFFGGTVEAAEITSPNPEDEKAKQAILQLKSKWEREAVQKFCQEIQRQVKMGFNFKHDGLIYMPWEHTVRSIINKKASGEPIEENKT